MIGPFPDALSREADGPCAIISPNGRKQPASWLVPMNGFLEQSPLVLATGLLFAFLDSYTGLHDYIQRHLLKRPSKFRIRALNSSSLALGPKKRQRETLWLVVGSWF